MDKYDHMHWPELADLCRQKDYELERSKTEIAKLEQMFDELMVIKQKIIDDLTAIADNIENQAPESLARLPVFNVKKKDGGEIKGFREKMKMTETQRFYGALVKHEISGEDTARNKQQDLADALDESIADAVNELKVTVRTMLMHYHCDYDPNLGRETELHREAIEKIKEHL